MGYKLTLKLEKKRTGERESSYSSISVLCHLYAFESPSVAGCFVFCLVAKVIFPFLPSPVIQQGCGDLQPDHFPLQLYSSHYWDHGREAGGLGCRLPSLQVFCRVRQTLQHESHQAGALAAGWDHSAGHHRQVSSLSLRFTYHICLVAWASSDHARSSGTMSASMEDQPGQVENPQKYSANP